MNTFEIFEQLGGKFYIDNQAFTAKTQAIKAYIFDWDGVFNDGSKIDAGSPYSEVDSMGTNLIRFAYWLKNKELPTVAIMTGENNQPAFYLAKRERLQAVYFKFSNKSVAFAHFLAQHNLKAHEVCFCFDDILDLSVAEQCGLRLFVKRDASPLLQQYVLKNKLADYQTANTGGKFAVREICELLLGVQENYDLAVKKRQDFDQDYQTYLAQRNEYQPQFFIFSQNSVVQQEI